MNDYTENMELPDIVTCRRRELWRISILTADGHECFHTLEKD